MQSHKQLNNCALHCNYVCKIFYLDLKRIILIINYYSARSAYWATEINIDYSICFCLFRFRNVRNVGNIIFKYYFISVSELRYLQWFENEILQKFHSIAIIFVFLFQKTDWLSPEKMVLYQKNLNRLIYDCSSTYLSIIQ